MRGWNRWVARKAVAALAADCGQGNEQPDSREQLALHPMHQHVVTCEAERSTLPGSRDTRITRARIAACWAKVEDSSYMRCVTRHIVRRLERAVSSPRGRHHERGARSLSGELSTRSRTNHPARMRAFSVGPHDRRNGASAGNPQTTSNHSCRALRLPLGRALGSRVET